MRETTVTFIGTSPVTPAAGHDTACLLINGKYLVDTGWYSTVKMLSYGYSPLDIDYVFITHCHHDHYMGLPQLLFYLTRRESNHAELRRLHVAGPAADIEKVVQLSLDFLQADRFPEAVHKPVVHPLAPGESIETPDFCMASAAALHPIQALAYKFTDKVTGKTIGIKGDTANLPDLVTFFQGVDMLVHEASFGPKPTPEENPYGHSGAPDAARIAKVACARRLALIHCPEEKQEAAIESAQKIFKNTFWPQEGLPIRID